MVFLYLEHSKFMKLKALYQNIHGPEEQKQTRWIWTAEPDAQQSHNDTGAIII